MPEDEVSASWEDDKKDKREYRKVSFVIRDLGSEGLTLEEITERSKVIKWYVKKKLGQYVDMGILQCVEGRYFKGKGE